MDNRIWITSEAETVADRYDLLTKVRDLDASDELGQYLIRASRAALPGEYRKDEEVLAQIRRVYSPEHICAVDVINDLERIIPEKRKSRLLVEEHRFDARAQAAYEAAGLPAELYLGKAACLPAHRFLYFMEAAENYFLRKEMDKKTIEAMIHNAAVLQLQLAAAAKFCGVAVEALAEAVTEAFTAGDGNLITCDAAQRGEIPAFQIIPGYPGTVVSGEGFLLFSGDGKGIATDFLFSEREEGFEPYKTSACSMAENPASDAAVFPGSLRWEEEVQL